MPYLQTIETLLDTTKNRVNYRVFKQSDIPERFDDGAITYLISMLEFLRRKKAQLSEPTTCEISKNAPCVSIIAPLSTFPKGISLYWAQDGEHIAGVALGEKVKDLKLPTYNDTIHTYGNFKDEDNMDSMCQLFLHRKHSLHASRLF